MNTMTAYIPTHRNGNDLQPFRSLWDEMFPFGGRLGSLLAPEPRAFAPALNVVETEHAFTLTAELPGVSKEDVKITVEDGVLTLSGEKKQEQEEKDASWHRVERSYGAFERSLTLPKGVDGDKAQASYRDGVLTITLPKAEHARPRTLKIS